MGGGHPNWPLDAELQARGSLHTDVTLITPWRVTKAHVSEHRRYVCTLQGWAHLGCHWEDEPSG